MGWDDRVIATALTQNIPWRIIRRRRIPNKSLEKTLDGIVHQFKSAAYGSINYLQVLNNNINYFEDMYWDLTKYKKILEELEGDLLE